MRDEGEAQRVDRAKVIAVAHSERGDLVDVVREATRGRGVDLALNGVGAVIHRPILDALADGGRMVVYSAAGGREVPLDLFELYRRRWQFAGVNTGILDSADCARILTDLAPLFETGQVRQRQPLEQHKLSAAASAYARVGGGAPAKVVLVPDARLS